MKLEQLKYFTEVVKCGSVNAASKQVFISQQSLNKSIHNMEAELGCELFNRTTKGMTLTEEGTIVLSAAQAVLFRWERMEEELTHLHGQVENLTGRLNIHASPMVSISIMPAAYVEYMHHYPRVQVACQDKYRDDLVRAVADYPEDVGYLLMPNSIEGFMENLPEDVVLTQMATYPIYMAMSPTHPLARQKSLSLRSVEKYPVIVFEAGGSRGRHAFQQAADIDVRLSTNNYQMCKEFLRDGNSLMYSFPPYLDHKVFSEYVHLPVSVHDICFEFYLVYNRQAPNAQRHLIDTFTQVLQPYL